MTTDGDPTVPALKSGGPGAGDPHSTYLGLRWDGPCTVRLTIRPELINNAGLLYGPVAFALVDYAMGSALWVETSEEEQVATINIAINFVASASSGEAVCRARLDRRNGHVAVLSAETHHEDGRLLATAVGSFSIFRPRRLPGA